MIPVISRRNSKSKTGLVGSKYYWLYDKFTTDRTAGNIAGTQAEPYGGVREGFDSNNKFSISSGQLVNITGSVSFNGLRWPQKTRKLGLSLLLTTTATTVGHHIGWDQSANTQANVLYDGFAIAPTSLYVFVNQGLTVVGTCALSTAYTSCITQRASGNFYFIKGGVYTNWTLVWISTSGTYNGLPRVASPSGGANSYDNVRIPRSLYIPVPLASDGFSATTTDGLGNAENNGPTGTSYTAVGTWGVSGGALSCSALDTGIGLRYLNTSSADVIIDADLTRTAGVAGIVARYEDASNYLIAYHDGTNFKLDKVVAGTTTNLVSAAGTYGAGRTGRLVLEGTSARIFYNNAAIGAAATVPSSSITKHGLYTTDTGNSFDNFVVWARGTGNEYSFLDTV